MQPEATVNFEENAKKFEVIKDLCSSDEEFQDIVMKISLLEVIIGQINEIFIGSIYNENSKAMIDAANKSVEMLQKNIVQTYVNNSKELQELMPIPDVAELSTWVEEIHYDIAMQVYTEGFCNTVILPALQTISNSVVEFAEEDSPEESEIENNLNEEQ